MTLRTEFLSALAGLCCSLALLAVAPDVGARDAPPTLSRTATAERLVKNLSLDNTNYEHSRGSVTWTGTVASHTDCSGFIDHLLMHVDGYTPEDFKQWFGKDRPKARHYHDAIAEGKGFSRLRSVTELKAGDLIAIKYLTRTDNTGHIMLVAEAPQRMSAAPPFVNGTTQWSVVVIDSSGSGHGPLDTRHQRGVDGRDHDGLGRGVFRLYTDPQNEVIGFAWSTAKAALFIAPKDEHVVLGRLIPGYKP